MWCLTQTQLQDDPWDDSQGEQCFITLGIFADGR